MCSNVLTFPEERSEHWIKPGSIPCCFLDILQLNVLIKGIFHIYLYHSMNIERNKTVKSGVCKYH